MQFLARDGDGAAIGFATVYWLWSTTSATRIGLMNDLFVAPEARGTRRGEALIERCRAALPRARRLQAHVADREGQRAARRRVYDRIGGERSEWLDYSLRRVGSRGHEESSNRAKRSATSRAGSSAEPRSRRRRPAPRTSTWACFRVPAGARSRPHYHEACESAVYMLSGRLSVKWGDHLEERGRDRPRRHGLRAAARDAHPPEPARHASRRSTSSRATRRRRTPSRCPGPADPPPKRWITRPERRAIHRSSRFRARA